MTDISVQIDERVHAYLSRPPMAMQPVVREYRCTECKEPLTVTNKAPESYAPDWQVKPCQGCLDKLEEATKDEKDEEWAEVEADLKDEHEIDKDVWCRDALQYANEISALKGQRDELLEAIQSLPESDSIGDGPAERVGSILARVAALETELQATKLLLKDAKQAHIFAKFRADRLSGEE